jgi:hypothetical protein
MKWRDETLSNITERISTLGLTTCPVCSSGTLAAWRKPVILPIGGPPWSDDEIVTAGSNILTWLVCSLCGHTLLFDSEKFHHGDEYTLERE